MSKPTKYYLVSEKELMFLEKAKIVNQPEPRCYQWFRLC